MDQSTYGPALWQAGEDKDEFLESVVTAIYDSIGGELNAETLGALSSDQVTLLAYHILREEVMDGGFVQLIHNGYGPFFFQNPFAKAIGLWGLNDLKRLMYQASHLYRKHGSQIERDCSDDEFMALFESYPDFDELDDTFVENEEEWTGRVADYVKSRGVGTPAGKGAPAEFSTPEK